MGFFSISPFICFAKWAYVRLDGFHKIINDTLLMITGMEAYRAEFAYLGQRLVEG
jgi:hypothetical protein